MNVWPDRHRGQLPALRAAVREASLVIAVSAPLAARVRDVTGIDAMVLPIGSDHRSLAARALPREDARRALGLDDARIAVLFVGNLLDSKGVTELVDAILANGSRFTGIFVGDGPLRGYGTDRPGGLQSLRFTGPRPHNEIATYMSAADVLVLPSHREGLPTVLVEAGSLGLPVIATAVGGIPELLGKDRGILLRDVSADAISDALSAFEGDRVGAEHSAARLRRHVLMDHDVDANAVDLLRRYRSLERAPAGGPRSAYQR
jgi:teichuronic acid biosynthesis glycosyltransferase TuaC